MSGLSPVPRIPKRPSTMNGSEAERQRGERDPDRAAQRRPAAEPAPQIERGDRRGERDRDERRGPLARQPNRPPGERAQRGEADRRRSHDQARRPQATRIAWPTSAAAPSTIRKDA